MSLNADFSKIENHEQLAYIEENEGNHPITDGIVWNMMLLGIGWELDDKTIPEFYFRMQFQDKLFGPLMQSSNGSRPITLDEIRAHKGLRVNVALEKRQTWVNRMVKSWFRDQEQSISGQVGGE